MVAVVLVEKQKTKNKNGIPNAHPSAPASHVGGMCCSFGRSNRELGPASPGTVGALTDEQGAPRTADGAVSLVSIIVVQEEGLQELILSREQRLSM